MIKKVKITRVAVTDKKKDGSPCMSSTGKKYKRVGIQTDATGEEWWSTNVFNEQFSKEIKLKAGDEVLVKFDKSTGYNNFSIATKTDVLEERITACEQRLRNIEHINKIAPPGQPNFDVPVAKEDPKELSADEIDF